MWLQRRLCALEFYPKLYGALLGFRLVLQNMRAEHAPTQSPTGLYLAAQNIHPSNTQTPSPMEPYGSSFGYTHVVEFMYICLLFFCNLGQPPSTRAYTCTLNGICGQQWCASWPHNSSPSASCAKWRTLC